jgi:hypothetical protein
VIEAMLTMGDQMNGFGIEAAGSPTGVQDTTLRQLLWCIDAVGFRVSAGDPRREYAGDLPNNALKLTVTPIAGRNCRASSLGQR